MFRMIKWLYPGMRVKRWILVIFVGLLLCCFGTMALVFGLLGDYASATSKYSWAALFFLLGGVFLLTGVYRLMKSLAELLGQRPADRDLVDVAFERRYLGLGPRIVALGGGTGMSTLLAGAKEYTAQVTAIVSVADDGGSSGRLRREFDILPPGDIRKCLVALSDESALLGELMRYRFDGENLPADGRTSDLAGHSFGNLLLTVLWRLTGDFGEAVRHAARILSIRGKVIPSTLDRVSLVAHHEDGSTTVGQRQISESHRRIRSVELRPNPGPASPDIVEAVEQAELVVIGPGSLYTSVLPNLLIEGICGAIRRSAAVKVYVANVASREGETKGYTLRDHLVAIREHTGPLPFDFVLVNDSSSLPRSVVREMDALGGRFVSYEPSDFQSNGFDVRFEQAELVSGEDFTLHEPRKLARSLFTIMARERDAK